LNKKILTFAIILLTLPVVVSAAQFKAGDNVLIDQVLDDNLYASGGNIEITNTVNGDLYAAGGMITIDGTVNGDIVVAGGQIKINADVEDIRAAGGQLTVNSHVTGDTLLAGGMIKIGKDAVIERDLLISGGQITIDGTVNGNVNVNAGEFTISPTAAIKGNLTYSAPEEIDTTMVEGNVEWIKPEPQKTMMREIIIKIVFMLMLIVTGFVILRLFGSINEQVNRNITKSLWKSLGFGFLTLIIVPIVSVLLMITIVAIPVGLILLICYGITIFSSLVFVSYTLGWLFLKKIFKKQVSKYYYMICGAILFIILISIPFIGIGIVVVSILLGLGGVSLVSIEFLKKRKGKK